MKKAIVIISSILAFFVAISAVVVAIDYNMSHKKYVKATINR